MTKLLEGARRSLAGCKNPDCAVCEELRTAIAKEEANPFGYCSDGKSWADHALDERLRRVAAEKERDELRAKLAQVESAEPVAWRYRDEPEYNRWILLPAKPNQGSIEWCAKHDRNLQPLYTDPAPEYTPAYTPIPWGELEEIYEQNPDFEDCARAIERAVLERLGVGS